jgi:hypothetical protein
MILEITMWEVVIIFCLVLIYKVFLTALNLAYYKKLSNSVNKDIAEIFGTQKECKKK